MLRVLPVCLIALTLMGGCSGQPDEDAAPADSQQARDSDDAGSNASREGQDGQWVALYLGDNKVGYQHTLRRGVKRGGRDVVEIDRTLKFNALRYQGLSEISTTTHVVETPDERVIEFESSTNMGSGDMKLSGRIADGQLHYRTQGSQQRVEAAPWSDAPCGTMIWENSLADNPPEPGERRTMKMLDLGVDRALAVDVELLAERYEETKLLDEARSLLRIQITIAYPGQPTAIKMNAWCDERGRVLKTVFPFLGKDLTALSVSREQALAEGGPLDVDIGLDATVKVRRKLADPHATRRIVYEARLPEGDPSTAFLTTSGQTVEKIDDHTARVTVRAVRPTIGPALPGDPEPSTEEANAADLAPGALIESDAPEVVALADSAAPDEHNAWKLALALEKLVADKVQNDNFSTTLGTAAQTARTGKGDCTEHAMLLAAVCRAREIPARVAIGLVYVEPRHYFAYHMWTEVLIDGQWIPLDATLGQGGIGAAHLTLVETNFKDAGIDAFLPVFNVIGKLELKIVEVDPS